jgi:hypothetical protein
MNKSFSLSVPRGTSHVLVDISIDDEWAAPPVVQRAYKAGDVAWVDGFSTEKDLARISSVGEGGVWVDTWVDISKESATLLKNNQHEWVPLSNVGRLADLEETQVFHHAVMQTLLASKVNRCNVGDVVLVRNLSNSYIAIATVKWNARHRKYNYTPCWYPDLDAIQDGEFSSDYFEVIRGAMSEEKAKYEEALQKSKIPAARYWPGDIVWLKNEGSPQLDGARLKSSDPPHEMVYLDERADGWLCYYRLVDPFAGETSFAKAGVDVDVAHISHRATPAERILFKQIAKVEETE